MTYSIDARKTGPLNPAMLPKTAQSQALSPQAATASAPAAAADPSRSDLRLSTAVAKAGKALAQPVGIEFGQTRSPEPAPNPGKSPSQNIGALAHAGVFAAAAQNTQNSGDTRAAAAFNQMNMATLGVAMMSGLQTNMTDRQVAIRNKEGMARGAQFVISQDMDTTSKLRTQLNTRTLAAQNLQALSQNLGTPRSQSYLQGLAQAGKLPQLNKDLAESGLSIRLDDKGTPTFWDHDKQLSEPEFTSRFPQVLAQSRAHLEQDTKILAEHNALAHVHIDQAIAINQDLGSDIAAQERDLATYKAQFEQLKANLPELLALQNDEDFWKDKPPELRALYNQALSEAQETSRQAAPTIAAQEQVIHHARGTYEQLEKTISQGKARVADTNNYLDQLRELQKDLGKAHAQMMERLRAERGEAVAENLKLCSEIGLAPQPDQAQAAETTQQMVAALEKLSAAIKRETRVQLTQQSFQAHIQQEYLLKTLQNAEYHLKKLQELDQHQKDRVNQALQQARHDLEPNLRQVG